MTASIGLKLLTIFSSISCAFMYYQNFTLKNKNNILEKELQLEKLEKQKLTEYSENLINQIETISKNIINEQSQNVTKTSEIIINHNATNSENMVIIGGILFIGSIIFGICLYYALTASIVTPIIENNANNTLTILKHITNTANTTNNLIEQSIKTSNINNGQLTQFIISEIQEIKTNNIIYNQNLHEHLQYLNEKIYKLNNNLFVVNENVIAVGNRVNSVINNFTNSTSSQFTNIFPNNNILQLNNDIIATNTNNQIVPLLDTTFNNYCLIPSNFTLESTNNLFLKNVQYIRPFEQNKDLITDPEKISAYEELFSTILANIQNF